MKISFHMNLSELAGHMGDGFITEAEARCMRRLLADSNYFYTEDVPDSIWQEMLDKSAYS